VLGIFGRLSEDLHEFDSGLDQQRKKEMMFSLTENISHIYSFVLQNLQVRDTRFNVLICNSLCENHQP